jgi:hypothetical protein
VVDFIENGCQKTAGTVELGWAWRNCSTVRAEAMASRAFTNTASSPLAGRDMSFSIKADGDKLLH